VISFVITTGTRHYPVIGVYIPSSDTTTLAFISEAANRFADQPSILIGNINVDFRTNTPSNRDTEITALLATLGLEDMSGHFIQRRNFRHGNTWSMERHGIILRLFNFVQIADPKYNSDHLMVVGGLQSAPKWENVAYLKSRRRFPLRTQHTTTLNLIENEYTKLKQYIELKHWKLLF
jgi:hypothetical protein